MPRRARRPWRSSSPSTARSSKEYETVRAEVLARFTADQQAAEQALQDAHWEAMEASDAARGGLNLPLKEILAGLDSRWHELEKHPPAGRGVAPAARTLGRVPRSCAARGVILEKHPGRRFCHALEQAQVQFRTPSQAVPAAAVPRRSAAGDLSCCCGPWRPIRRSPCLGWHDWRWAAVSGGLAAAGGHRGRHVDLPRRQAAIRSRPIWPCGARCWRPDWGTRPCSKRPRPNASGWTPAIIARHKTRTYKADETHAIALAQDREAQADRLAAGRGHLSQTTGRLVAWRDRTLQEIEAKYPPLLRQIEEHYRTESERLRARHDAAMEESRQRFEREWTEMAERWRTGMERFRASAEEIDAVCREAFPDWNTEDWNRWTLPTAIPPVVRFGTARSSWRRSRAGVPEDERLRPARLDFTLPVLLPYPRRSLLLLKAHGPGRARAVDVMQSAMLRLLTAMPPGKVRFTIIDPVGLGDNFSAFMHLADYDEQLVASRIWTDTGHIEQRLADLTKHMENVIQVYLRKEFHSIEEYNAFAGEMAEPYRVLVVANFPANFSEAAAHRHEEHRGQRRAVRRVRADERRHEIARCRATSNCPTGADALVLRWAEGQFRLGAPRLRAAGGQLRSAAAGRTVQGDSPHGRQRGERQRAGRGALLLHHPRAQGLVDGRQPHRHRRAAGPRRRHEIATPGPRRRHLAARVDLRQDRLGQVDLAARLDDEPGPALQSPTRWNSTWSTSRRAWNSRPTPGASCRTRG